MQGADFDSMDVQGLRYNYRSTVITIQLQVENWAKFSEKHREDYLEVDVVFVSNLTEIWPMKRNS